MHLLYLVQSPFTPRDARRFGIPYLLSKGCTISVIDVTEVVFPNSRAPKRYDHGSDIRMEMCRTLSEFVQFRELLSAADAVYCLVGSGRFDLDNFMVLREVGRARTRVVLPLNNANWFAARGVGEGRMAVWRARLSRFRVKRNLFGRLPPWMLGLRKAEFALYSGTMSRNSKRPLVGSRTRPIISHAYDYDLFLEEEERAGGTAVGSEPMAVFVDQYLGLHPDAAMMEIKQPFHPDEYYPTLQTFFSEIEDRLGLEVVIALHPRSEYQEAKKIFGHRRIFRNATPGLIRKCRLVMTSYSTAVNFAVLWRRPVILCGPQKLLEHVHLGRVVRRLGDELGAHCIDVAKRNEVSWKDMLDVDDARHANFEQLYIKESGSPREYSWVTLYKALAA